MLLSEPSPPPHEIRSPFAASEYQASCIYLLPIQAAANAKVGLWLCTPTYIQQGYTFVARTYMYIRVSQFPLLIVINVARCARVWIVNLNGARCARADCEGNLTISFAVLLLFYIYYASMH